MTIEQIRQLYPDVDSIMSEPDVHKGVPLDSSRSVSDKPEIIPYRKESSGKGSAVPLVAVKPTEFINNDDVNRRNASLNDYTFHRSPSRSTPSPFITNIGSLTPASIVKIGALVVSAFYIYKSVKDGGVQIKEGEPKRNIFKWIDAACGLIIAVYLFQLARNTMMF